MNRHRIGDVAEILLGYVESGKTFQTEEIMSVPPDTYTDPDMWCAEQELIFRRLPLMLALTCEMPKPGDYKTMDVIGLPVLLVRDKRGTVRGFINVCSHRWAPVARGQYGNCSRFTCPFHGWTYGLDGKLVGVADRAKFGDLERATHGLKELPCEERHGMIFACLTPDAPLDLDAYYGALLEEYAFASLKDWTFTGSRVIEGGNWKLTFNNFLESYHFATLHANTVAHQAQSNVSHYEGFGPNMRTGLALSGIAKLREMPRAQWEGREGEEFGFIRVFFPNVTGFIRSGRSALFTQTFPGAAPDKCRIVFLFLRRDAPRDESERESIENALNDDTATHEDNGINLAIQKGLKSGAHAGLLYGRNERGNQYFHEWLRWYLRGNPDSIKPVM